MNKIMCALILSIVLFTGCESTTVKKQDNEPVVTPDTQEIKAGDLIEEDVTKTEHLELVDEILESSSASYKATIVNNTDQSISIEKVRIEFYNADDNIVYSLDTFMNSVIGAGERLPIELNEEVLGTVTSVKHFIKEK